MENIEQKNTRRTPRMTFIAVAVAPVVAFVLANALFLPLTLAVLDIGDSFLAKLLYPFDPLSSRLIFIVFIFFVPVTGAGVLVGPALTSFVVNLIIPILTNWSRAIWSGIVFFFFHSILLIILLVIRNIPLFPTPEPYYPFPTPVIDPLAIGGLLAGVVLSCSVTIFGWLGARLRRKKS
jgi:hypothetical protein